MELYAPQFRDLAGIDSDPNHMEIWVRHCSHASYDVQEV
jgi:hypothetical protein